MWHLDVRDFPAIVTMDAHGNSLHKDVEEASGKILETLAYGRPSAALRRTTRLQRADRRAPRRRDESRTTRRSCASSVSASPSACARFSTANE